MTKTIVDELDLAPDHRAFCLEGDFAGVRIEPEPEIESFRPYLKDLPPEATVSCWGIGRVPLVTEDGAQAGYKAYRPLASVDSLQELRRYPFPNLAESGADEGLEGKVGELKARGFTVLGQMSQTILETAYEMRGLPRLMMDFYDQPGYVSYLFEAIAEQRCFQARRFAEAGVDIVRLGDDIGTQYSLLVSPKLYAQRIKPMHAKVIAAARSVNPDIHVKYHSDGNVTSLLPHFIQIGINIINPVQPECMDLAEIKREYGHDLTLWGCTPVQSLFANGSRAEIIDFLQFLMDDVAVDGGLVVKFTNFLATSKSMENLKVFFEVFYDLGRYRAP